ncbi:MAG TPA: GNAT family N-acetyltransferase [Nocardioidaceae bacterium]|nr:GNAT family N-acetyltransferase [Nocardioidaceae bacterium]
MPLLRPVTEDDHAKVLALNERNVEMLAPMSAERLAELAGLADRFDVVELDGDFAGFVVTFAPGTTYDSENYRWFSDRYPGAFYYLDRIVLDDRFRRRGLGGFVYGEMEQRAKEFGRLALEVNLEPRNDASLAFHSARGYTEVGRLGDDGHLVSLMVKELA